MTHHPRAAQIADWIDRFADRLVAGPAPGAELINRRTFPPEQAGEVAAMVRAMASSVRAGLVDADGADAAGAVASQVRSGPAVADVVAFRVQQIVQYDYLAEDDADLPPDRLPRMAKERLVHAIDQIACAPDMRNLPAARKNLARAGAVVLAAMDRIDVEITKDAT